VEKNLLFYGDNLEVLKKYNDFVGDESVDLIYLDPPWNKKKTYNALFRERSGEDSPAQIKAFHDTWRWDQSAVAAWQEVDEIGSPKVKAMIDGLISFLGRTDVSAYMAMITVRLLHLHRVLRRGGALYFHCDPTMSHYVKIVLDAIFGHKAFQNEIIWLYRGGGRSSKRFACKHDVIFFYTKPGEEHVFNADSVRIPYEAEGISRTDESAWGRHAGQRGIYRPHSEGKVPEDHWNIAPLNANDPERLSYPTQKPLELLERIIKASSNNGDVVLDPFCGCGTAVIAAEKLKRQWIGIDITHLAIGLIEKRFWNAFGKEIENSYLVKGRPTDVPSAENLALRNRLEFERWAVDFVGGHPIDEINHGVDGVILFRDEPNGRLKKVVIQIKSGSVTPDQVRSLVGTVKSQRADMGFFVTLRGPTPGMKSAAAEEGLFESALGKSYPKMQIRTIADLFDGRMFKYPASLNVTFKEARRIKQHPEAFELL